MLNQHRDVEEEVRDLIHRPVRIQTLDRVILELERLARTKSSRLGAIAKASLELIAKRNYSIVENNLGSPDVDTCLIAQALIEKKSTLVASVDRELRETLASQGISTVCPKKGRGLVIFSGSCLARFK
jgi:rRNA-processing protein FCF1